MNNQLREIELEVQRLEGILNSKDQEIDGLIKKIEELQKKVEELEEIKVGDNNILVQIRE